MWLDAFRPKSGTMQKSGVPGVPRVPKTANPISMRVSLYRGAGTPANVPNVPRVPVVPKADKDAGRDTRDTVGHQLKKPCPTDEKSWRASIHEGLRVAGTPGTRGTPQKQYEPGIDDSQRQSLVQFEFDLMQAEIDAGYPVEELNRVNNMAWEFMQVDRMTFDKAIKLAAEIVVHGQVTACEAAYEDVQALWRKVMYA